jgi:hypothetical protein
MFGECERMCYYCHVLGRLPAREDRFTLHWGNVFHGATEIWDTTKDIEAVEAFIIENLDVETDDKYGRNRGRMFQLFVTWLEYTQLHPQKILRTEQPVLIECRDRPCPYSPTGCDLVYGGRMDRIVEWDGLVGPKDYKTTVMTESDPISEYRPNHQTMGYVWQASHLLGKHCWGIIVERAICNKSKIDISRFPVPFSKDNIRQWVINERELQRSLQERFAKHRWDESKWKQNYARCFKPYPCAYRDVCLSPVEGNFRYRWMRDNTIERRWDFNRPDAQEVANATD